MGARWSILPPHCWSTDVRVLGRHCHGVNSGTLVNIGYLRYYTAERTLIYYRQYYTVEVALLWKHWILLVGWRTLVAVGYLRCYTAVRTLIYWAVLHCWGGSTILLKRRYYAAVETVLLCWRDSTTLLKRQYYTVEEAVLHCWSGSTALLKRQYYTAEEAVLHCWRYVSIVVCGLCSGASVE
jgi:hypothetical protein